MRSAHEKRDVWNRPYLLFINFIHIGCVFTEMKCTKQNVIGVHPCSFTGNEIYKTKCHRVHFQCSFTGYELYNAKLPLFNLRRNTLEINTIYSYTRTLIGQKNIRNVRLTDKTFFWLTPWIRYLNSLFFWDTLYNAKMERL